MTTTPFSLLLLSLLLLGGCFGIGTVLGAALRLPLPGFFGLFVRLLTGLVVMVVGYAVVATAGNTVLWLLGFVLVMLLRSIRTSSSDLLRPAPWRWPVEALFVLGVGLVITAVRLPLLYNMHTGQLEVPYYDFVFYARLIFPLNSLGVETITIDPVYPAFSVPQPYHYFELWLNALAVRATGLVSINTLYISIYSVLIAVLYVAYCAVFEHFGYSRRWTLALAAVCLPLTGLRLPGFGYWSVLDLHYDNMSNFFFIHPKLTTVALFLTLGFLMYLKGQVKAALWSLMALPVVFISTAPALATGCGIWALYYIWSIRPAKPLGALMKLLLPMIAIFGGIALFYGINSVAHQGERLTSHPGSMVASLGFWRHAPAFMGGLLLSWCAYHAVYLALLAALARGRFSQFLHRNQSLLILSGLLVVCGGVMWFAFTPFYECWQLFNNISMSATAVLLVVLLADALAANRPWVRTGVLVLLAGVATGNYVQEAVKIDLPHMNTRYSQVFLNQVRHQLANASPVGGFVLDIADYQQPFAYNAAAYLSGLYVPSLRNDLNLVSLSQINADTAAVVARFPERAAALRYWIANAPINRFYKKALLRNPGLSRPDAVRQFVQAAHINFVCVSAAGQLPETLRPLVRLRLLDSVTGEQFYMLKV